MNSTATKCPILNLPTTILDKIFEQIFPSVYELKYTCKFFNNYVGRKLTYQSQNFYKKIQQNKLNIKFLKTNNPPPRCSHSCAIIKNFMYIYNGFNSENQLVRDFWKINLETHKWTKIVPNISNQHYLPATGNCLMDALDDYNLIIFGGYTVEPPVLKFYNDVYIYNLVNNNVTKYSCDMRNSDDWPGPSIDKSAVVGKTEKDTQYYYILTDSNSKNRRFLNSRPIRERVDINECLNLYTFEFTRKCYQNNIILEFNFFKIIGQFPINVYNVHNNALFYSPTQKEIDNVLIDQLPRSTNKRMTLQDQWLYETVEMLMLDDNDPWEPKILLSLQTTTNINNQFWLYENCTWYRCVSPNNISINFINAKLFKLPTYEIILAGITSQESNFKDKNYNYFTTFSLEIEGISEWCTEFESRGRTISLNRKITIKPNSSKYLPNFHQKSFSCKFIPDGRFLCFGGLLKKFAPLESNRPFMDRALTKPRVSNETFVIF